VVRLQATRDRLRVSIYVPTSPMKQEAKASRAGGGPLAAILRYAL
jgi:hypothetical protein